MKVYVTGSDDRAALLEVSAKLKQKGYSPTTPWDIVDDGMDEHTALRERLKAVLCCDMVVTTGPHRKQWGAGAVHEVSVARMARIKVEPEVRIIP
jgi:hypothetical protein